MRVLATLTALGLGSWLAACAAKDSRPSSAAAREAGGQTATEKPQPSEKYTRSHLDAHPNEMHDLRFDEPLVLDDGALVIEWLDIDDSRCPRGTNCVWIGEVGIVIAVMENGKELENRDLILRLNEEQVARTETAEHVIRLIRVLPYPTHGVETERPQYSARLEIGARKP